MAVAVAGIGFAVLLMFMQVGFQNALFDSQVKLIDDLNADIFIVNKAKYTLASEKRFPINRIYQARSAPGVAGAYPFYSELTTSVLKNLAPGKRSKGYPIRSMGFFLGDPVFRSPEIAAQTYRLRLPHSVLVDVRSKRKNFDFPVRDEGALAQHDAELAGQRISMVGTFEMGTDFAHDGNLIMSAENFGSLYGYRKPQGDPLSVVDLGLVQLKPGADLEKTRDLIDRLLEDDVWVYTREQFRKQEIGFWDRSTPIGIVFAAGKIIGFVVGMVICYQVIYSDIADHMPEFATLKAMGYSSGYFLRMIVVEAVLLSGVGFVPGMLASWGLYLLLADATGLQLTMTYDTASLVLTLTIAMCIASGLLAVRKLIKADPANLF
ncbi:MAG: FtsX-like permease family protein [Planctomycetales bacterium]|nr:FtsX-like permease family protein [Planctomycetales bacterium]